MAGWFSGPRRNNPGIRRALFAAGVFLAPVVCSPAAASDSGKVTAVRFWSLGDVTRIAIEVSSDFTFKFSELAGPPRLFFDIHGARPQMVMKGVHTIAVGDGLVQNIRIAETQPEVTRIVLDLVETASVTTSQLSNPSRLMIEVRSKDRPSPNLTGRKDLTLPGESDENSAAASSLAAKPVATLAALKNTAKPEPRKFEPPSLPQTKVPLTVPEVEAPRFVTLPKTERLPPVAASLPRALPPPPAAPGPRTRPVPVAAKQADRSLTRALGLKLERVVLDAGHGGNDVGTHGPSGYYEKDLTLDVAQRLGALIEQRMGSEVVYTRSDDTYVGLEERTRIANQREADLFLSIHANSSPYRATAGVETYVLNFTTSKSALELAARENATSDRSIHQLHELLEKIALKDKIDESREFAAKLQTSLSVVSKSGAQGAKNRGVKTAPFVVLIGAAMPSVLAEIGFLTNSTEEALLRKPEHRQKIAEALYKGITAYADTLSRIDVARK
jgi:N-acetylmuramoyl-L-alanine amidase